jgi:hypothetical protein
VSETSSHGSSLSTFQTEPPLKTAAPTPGNVKALTEWLSSILCYRARSEGRPWLFYEEIDRYLGPWGSSGYPLGYGRRYCQLFYGNAELKTSPATRDWVHKTLLMLQVAIKNFVLQRFRRGTLGRLTEPEFRQAAFDSHPEAYTEGGLAMVAVVAPTMIPVIATIPRLEFTPTSSPEPHPRTPAVSQMQSPATRTISE